MRSSLPFGRPPKGSMRSGCSALMFLVLDSSFKSRNFYCFVNIFVSEASFPLSLFSLHFPPRFRFILFSPKVCGVEINGRV